MKRNNTYHQFDWANYNYSYSFSETNIEEVNVLEQIEEADEDLILRKKTLMN